MEDKYELILELWELYKRKDAIENELRKFFHDKAVNESPFTIGETVMGFDNDNYIGDGIINKISHGLNYGWDAYYVKKYCEDKEKFYEALKDIRYNVRAIKKDGTQSERNLGHRASYGAKTDHKGFAYITKKQTT